MINRQLHTDAIDLQIADHLIIGDGKSIIVPRDLIVVDERKFCLIQCLVVCMGFFKKSRIICRFQILQDGFIVHNGTALGLAVPKVTDGGI